MCQNEGTKALCCEAVDDLLETFATDDLIEYADVNLMQFIRLSKKSPTEYVEILWRKALRCSRVNDENVHKSIYVESLLESIHHSMQSYWGSRKNTTVHALAPHVTFQSNYNMVCAPLMPHGTTPGGIPNVEVPEAKAEKVTTIVLIQLYPFNHLAKVSRSVYLDPLQRQCKYVINNQAPCNRFHSHHQRRQPTVPHYATFVRSVTM